jgi:hypothetical protein
LKGPATNAFNHGGYSGVENAAGIHPWGKWRASPCSLSLTGEQGRTRRGLLCSTGF